MNSYIYHIGITPPPFIQIKRYNICHFPLLHIEYTYESKPDRIKRCATTNPIIIIMSKNAVNGLISWIDYYNIDDCIFKVNKFWTVGKQTHDYLQSKLNIKSYFPKKMTSEGILQELQNLQVSNLLLISNETPQIDFINTLKLLKINWLHFPVYKTKMKIDKIFANEYIDSKNNFIVITAPSLVESLKLNLSISDLSKIKSKIISIGPTTSNAIERNNGTVFFESLEQDISLLYETINNRFI